MGAVIKKLLISANLEGTSKNPWFFRGDPWHMDVPT